MAENTIEQYQISGKLKKISIGLIVAGLIVFIIGALFNEHGSRLWANVLLDNVYFLALGLIGAFFIAANYLANAGWYTLIKRIPEAMMSWIPVAGVLMLVFIALAWMESAGVINWGLHYIWHWTDHSLYVEGSPEYDPIIADKKEYLNMPFFFARAVIYFVLWGLLAYLLRKASIREDLEDGLTYFKKSTVYAALFLVVFAITSSTAAWDWLMSIDTHWFSTLYGWYVFSSMFVAGLAAITLILIYLKKQGFMKLVTDEHLHDMGKYMFAFSIFWTYLWFCQFMLIWYANIPEETVYYKHRFEDFKFLFFFMAGINFLVPFLVLMTRDAKRKFPILIGVAVTILIGHWLDFYLMIMPGAVGVEHAGIGLLEIGLFAVYAGAFILVVFNALGKAYLVPKNHPYLEESVYHQT